MRRRIERNLVARTGDPRMSPHCRFDLALAASLNISTKASHRLNRLYLGRDLGAQKSPGAASAGASLLGRSEPGGYNSITLSFRAFFVSTSTAEPSLLA